ncbi:MAG: hypothetical protein KGI98_17640, partial [Euryarchaeota archaeon]|nr:hypothetical protein [Euryarchaeota archaeon]
GTLQQVDLQFVVVGDEQFVVYTAAAYRTPLDPRPGMGTAWEPVPGKTRFTRDSEGQNAETSAWGRAIIAAGAADASKIASREEVQNRVGDEGVFSVADLNAAMTKAGWSPEKQHEVVESAVGRVVARLSDLTPGERTVVGRAIAEEVK